MRSFPLGAASRGDHHRAGNYDDSLQWWKADGPSGAAKIPLFVITHSPPEDMPAGSVYTFVADGIHSGLQQVKVAAAGKDVAVIGGPDVGQQFLRAGLVDEIGIHWCPCRSAAAFGCSTTSARSTSSSRSSRRFRPDWRSTWFTAS